MQLLFALLAATLPLQSGAAAHNQLLPFGEFAARDGRPGPGKSWKLDDERGRHVAASLNAVAARTPIVIDYEHQTLHAPTNGKPAPAAGWIKRTEWQDGRGLFITDVEWTAAARAAIDAGEYRYLSPVIGYDADGRVSGVHLAAITNYPAIVGMDAVVAALNATPGAVDGANPPEDATVNPLLQKLLAAIGLPATTDEAAALTAVAALQAEVVQLRAKPPALPTALAAELGLAAGADELAALTAIKGLKTADAGTLQIVTQLQGQIAELRTQLNENGLMATVDEAIAAGKFAPAHREWLLGQGRKDLAALKAAIAAAPVIPGLQGQTAGRTDQVENTAALSADAARIKAAFGLSDEQWAKGAKQAA